MTAKRIPLAMLACFLLSIFCGCAASFQRGPEEAATRGDVAGRAAPAGTLRMSVDRYRSLAAQYEKEQQFYKAAFLWLVVQRLAPEDREAGPKVAVLEERIRAAANRHLLRGKAHAQQKSYPSARQDFLLTLAYDPNCKDALEWLGRHAADEGYIFYETKQGDTVRNVAQNIYLDPGKAFIVAYFSGKKESGSFEPQTTLKLPVIEPPLSQPEPRHRNAYRPATQPAAQKGRDKAGAEEHYRKGVAFFIAEDLQKAIREWEEALRLDPEHPNARRSIEKARKLLRGYLEK